MGWLSFWRVSMPEDEVLKTNTKQKDEMQEYKDL